jgi:hypothetical protein
VNVAVSLAAGEKNDVFAVSDGAGGAIVAWEDERAGDRDVYAQRIDVNGVALWTTDGVAVCKAAGDQHLYHSSTGTTGFTPILPDGEGGVFLVWQDARFFAARRRDIYFQRLDADGNAYFPQDGIPIAQGTGMEDQPTMCRDGSGGVIVVWQDKNSDPVFYDLWGQRVDGDGHALWSGGAPLPLIETGWDQDAPTIVPDGNGGAFLAWTDSRSNLNDVYAQRLDANGCALWPSEVVVAQSSNGQDAITIRRAADGHPVLSWVDRRFGTPDIYAQKLDAASGAALWTPGGLVVCNAAESQYRPALASDGAGGAFVGWYDFRNAPSGPPWNLDIYVQRVLANGTPAWIADGVSTCSAPDAQRDADIWSDGYGGVFVAWEDNRSGTGHEDIYAQHLNSAGGALLESDGRQICSAGNNQQRPDVLAGAGGMILAWKDDRGVLYEPDVYADRVLTATSSAIGVNRVLFDFGEPQSTVTDTFHVSNVGASDLVVLNVTLAQDAPGFSVSYAGGLPDTLFPGEIVEAVVSFDPAAGGSADTVLVFHDSPSAASPVSVPLRGIPSATGSAVPAARAAQRVQLRPNPFKSRTSIAFSLEAPGLTALEILDVRGRRVRLLDQRIRPAGDHAFHWDGRDDRGSRLPEGVYFVRLSSPGGTETSKALLIARP